MSRSKYVRVPTDEVNVCDVNVLSFVLGLLHGKNVVVEVLLELLVGVVNAKLQHEIRAP